MSNKIIYDNFDLLSVEVIGKKVVKIGFIDREQPSRKQSNDDKNLPHQHLIDRLQDLAPIMAKALGLTKGYDLAREMLAGKKDLDNLKVIKDAADDLEHNIEVTKLSFFGEKRASIQITGSVITDYGKQKQSTPQISLDPTKHDIAENAQTFAEEVKIEVFAYLFQDKYIKSEKKKKQDADKNAVEAFERAENNNGEFDKKEVPVAEEKEA